MTSSVFILVIFLSGSAKSSEEIEDFIPLMFPKLFMFFNKNSTTQINESSKNISKENPKNAVGDYLKGYSLKIPRKRIMENGFPKMKEIEQEVRNKRGVLHLYNMVSCATGCNPLNYKGYGCYCGFLGSGYPVDEIDRCCKAHDWCYDTAICPMFLEYFVPYYWKCWYNTPFCALHHGEFGGPGSCADRLCECDRALSICLKKYQCPTRRAFCKSSPLRFFQNAFMLIF